MDLPEPVFSPNWRWSEGFSLCQKWNWEDHTSGLCAEEGWRFCKQMKLCYEHWLSSFYLWISLVAFLIPQLEHPIGDDLNGALYDVMRKELRHAVEEIKMELEQVCPLHPLFITLAAHPVFLLKLLGFFLVQGMTKTKANDKCLQSKNIGALQTASTIRRNYAAKLEQVPDLIVAC